MLPDLMYQLRLIYIKMIVNYEHYNFSGQILNLSGRSIAI